LTGVNVLHSTQRNLSGGGDIAPLPEGWSKSAADKLVITFPQISAIWASTSRPMRTLRAMTAWEFPC